MQGFFEREFTFDRVCRIFFISLLVMAGLAFAWYIREALTPFFFGWIIAAILMPAVKFFQYRLKMKSRLLAIITTLLLIIALLGTLTWLIAPSVSEEITKASEILKRAESRIMQESIISKETSTLDLHNLDKKQIAEFVKTYVPKTIDIASQAIKHIFSLFGVIFILLYSIFIMIYYESFSDGFYELLPEKMRRPTKKIITDVVNGTSRYFKGQSLIAFLVGILFCIGFLIIGLPMAIPLGLFIGVLNLVPYAQLIGILPTALLCLIKSSETGSPFWQEFIFAMAVFAVVQTIQDTLLTPKILGKVTGLNPAIILLCLSIGGTLFGFWGFIMALPLAPMLLAYYHIYILKDVPKDEK